MVVVRPWGTQDRTGVAELDTAFTTEVIFEVVAGDGCFCLKEARLDAPLTKTYPIREPENPTGAFVAEEEGRIVGYAELVLESWNRRGNVRHLYVNPDHRGQGVGTALLRRVEEAAKEIGADSLWIETQNVNYPATQFYRHLGFALAGLDRSMYGPISESREVALFFTRDL